MIVGQNHRKRLQIVLRLRQRPRTHDRRRNGGIGESPCQRHLRWCRADLLSEGPHDMRDADGSFVEVPGRRDDSLARQRDASFSRVVHIRPGVLAGEHPATQRRPGKHAQSQRSRHWHQLVLDRALDQAVFDLQGNERRPSAQIGHRLQLGNAPCRRVANPEVKGLAGAYEIVQRAHHFVGSRCQIPRMQMKKINPIGPELAQALLYRPDQVELVVAAGIGISRIAGHRELGRKNDPFALVLEKFAENALGGAVGVVDRRVDEIATTVDIEIENPARVIGVGAPPPILAEGHGAERERGYAQARAAEQTIVGKRGHEHVSCAVGFLDCTGTPHSSVRQFAQFLLRW